MNDSRHGPTPISSVAKTKCRAVLIGDDKDMWDGLDDDLKKEISGVTLGGVGRFYPKLN